jgi:protoporphyrinogen oxidase
MSVSGRPSDEPVVIIGAGPAGLTAAYELAKRNHRSIVLEKQHLVGGLAKTDSYKGYRFDTGGHRFFTKNASVNAMWQEILGKDFLRRPRLSRIYYHGKFFAYPLRPFNALKGLGPIEAIRVLLSYVWWQFFPYSPEDTFERWVTNRFGRRLFLTFFKAYTEKVWGIPCSELKAEWAAQRIKDLSLRTAVLSMVMKPRRTIKTLIEEFDYPRLGPGMMWEAVMRAVEDRNGIVRLGSDVVRVCRSGNHIDGVVISCDGTEEVVRGRQYLSSMPLGELIKKLDPPPPAAVLHAARSLTHRDFLTVCMVIDKPDVFPDNWIYIQDPEVMVGRIQNFKNWSPEMVPDSGKTSLSFEYFCSAGDDFWNLPDEKLLELAKRELEIIGLAKSSNVEDGCVFRIPNAYPIYDSSYEQYLNTVRAFVETFDNLQTMGRSGLHRYNNQDHSMITARLAVDNLMNGHRADLWAVNADAEYHEEMEIEGIGTVTTENVAEAVNQALVRVFSKLDKAALGAAIGTVSGLAIFVATVWLVIRGGPLLGDNLQLLRQYFPGYTVSVRGSILGLTYGFLFGFVTGWLFAFLRNGTAFFYMAAVHRRAELQMLRVFFDKFTEHF